MIVKHTKKLIKLKILGTCNFTWTLWVIPFEHFVPIVKSICICISYFWISFPNINFVTIRKSIPIGIKITVTQTKFFFFCIINSIAVKIIWEFFYIGARSGCICDWGSGDSNAILNKRIYFVRCTFSIEKKDNQSNNQK